MSFKVGDEVVYVGGLCVLLGEPEPERDRVYTVSWVGIYGDTPFLDLVERPSPANVFFDRGYCQFAFRPAVKRKTDISIFTSMLTPNKQKVDA